jgi:hypothetical protein
MHLVSRHFSELNALNKIESNDIRVPGWIYGHSEWRWVILKRTKYEIHTCFIYMTCLSLFLSLFPYAPTSKHRAYVKRFVSLQFFNPKTVCRIPWMGNQLISRPLRTQTQNKHRQTSMLWVGFEPTIPAFEGSKTVHALDGAATVIGSSIFSWL